MSNWVVVFILDVEQELPKMLSVDVEPVWGSPECTNQALFTV